MKIASKSARASVRSRKKEGPLQRLERWKLEDAKARFSEVVRHASAEGPQMVTVRGKDTAVVVSAEDFARLQPENRRAGSLVDFLQTLHLSEIPLERELDRGRDIAL